MKMRSFELGIRFDDLEKARDHVEKCLRIKMRGVDSHAYGSIYYYYDFPNGTKLRLHQNWNAVDGELNQPDYEDFPLYILVDQPTQSKTFEKKLIDDSVLQAELLETDEY